MRRRRASVALGVFCHAASRGPSSSILIEFARRTGKPSECRQWRVPHDLHAQGVAIARVVSVAGADSLPVRVATSGYQPVAASQSVRPRLGRDLP